ncbi:apolipoprotein Ea [Limanda limanda]|uniref:apolipoprotein Ea n=1 Tax=Limanda limanda TaxID=27771 RepID=UPI0029C6814B|nr:apolipoprotein Ea [Limanda limanda]
MKVFAVIFVLAALSGCHARSMPEARSDPWEDALEKFKDYFTDLTSKSDAVLKNIRSSEITRELDTLIQDSMSELAVYRQDMQTKLAPITQEAAERLGDDLDWLSKKLRVHMDDGREQMEKYSVELQTMLEQNAEDVRVRVSAYTRKMKKRINKDAEEIKSQVAAYFEELQTRASNNVGQMQTQFEPYIAKVRDNTQAKVTTLNDLLMSQVDKMAIKMQRTAEDIKDQLEDTAEDMKSTLEEKMEEVRTWFQPFVSMITG